jgi:hypothetical protein
MTAKKYFFDSFFNYLFSFILFNSFLIISFRFSPNTFLEFFQRKGEKDWILQKLQQMDMCYPREYETPGKKLITVKATAIAPAAGTEKSDVDKNPGDKKDTKKEP